MDAELITIPLPTAQQLMLPINIPPAAPLATLGQAADHAAATRVFVGYRDRRADETVRRQDADLALFGQFLAAAGVASGALATDASAWRGVTWGLVSAFVQWQIQQGYAIGSVNVRLSTVKVYAKLAVQAGAIDAECYALITTVAGYRRAEGKRVDAKRAQTRVGDKKAAPVSINRAQALRLKQQPDARDQLLMCLLLDHGLRVGEVAALTPACFDLDRGVLRFYRQKVDKTQSHRLSDATLLAAEAYLPTALADRPLFGVDRTIRTRVQQLGAAVGLDHLSPHDCRHAWATFATRAGTPLKALQDAGGWSSPAMPLSYAESAAIANEGVQLG